MSCEWSRGGSEVHFNTLGPWVIIKRHKQRQRRMDFVISPDTKQRRTNYEWMSKQRQTEPTWSDGIKLLSKALHLLSRLSSHAENIIKCLCIWKDFSSSLCIRIKLKKVFFSVFFGYFCSIWERQLNRVFSCSLLQTPPAVILYFGCFLLSDQPDSQIFIYIRLIVWLRPESSLVWLIHLVQPSSIVPFTVYLINFVFILLDSVWLFQTSLWGWQHSYLLAASWGTVS